jgi:hypothetical protein
MIMAWKSVLKPEGSLMLGAAVAIGIFSLYQLDVGPVAAGAGHRPQPPDPGSSSRKKAGYTSLVLVAGLAVLAKDPNIVILGGAAIIAMEAHYRHAIMAHPDTGQMIPPTAGDFQDAQNVIPLDYQAQTG